MDYMWDLLRRTNATCATSGCSCSICATYGHLCLYVHLNRSCMWYVDESYYVLEWKMFFLIMLVWKIIWPIMQMWKNNSSILIINLCYHCINMGELMISNCILLWTNDETSLKTKVIIHKASYKYSFLARSKLCACLVTWNKLFLKIFFYLKIY
jgi:hypothetical protein